MMGIPLGQVCSCGHTTGCHCGECNQCKFTWAEMNGRERDAWLAEKAMGFTWIQWDYGTARLGNGLVETEFVAKHPEWTPCERPDSITDGMLFFVPHYTTDLTAAMALLEAMRKKGCFVIVKLFPCDPALAPLVRPDSRISECHICDTESRYFIAEGQTLPAEIAECVYQALGGY